MLFLYPRNSQIDVVKLVIEFNLTLLPTAASIYCHPIRRHKRQKDIKGNP